MYKVHGDLRKPDFLSQYGILMLPILAPSATPTNLYKEIGI